MSGKHILDCIYGYGQPHQHIDLMPVSSIRCSKWMPYTLRCSQRIHKVAWNLAYRRHNSEFPVESSPIEATISGIHIQGCIFGYRQLHQHIDLIALIFTWHAEYEGCPFRDITVTMVARTFLYNSITRFGVPAKLPTYPLVQVPSTTQRHCRAFRTASSAFMYDCLDAVLGVQ
ncbi:Ferredoxin--NADP reductase [Trichinella spiralis]|uniref:Ferredoxin--NADP reductase n=1 Tax=Trichinella spiralis TaxID=6334 RepID=A0ABR3KJE7_TRISP